MLLATHGLIWSSVWAFVWGIATVILRYGWHTPRPILLWGLLGFIPAIAGAVIAAKRQWPKRTAVCALLDHHHRAGGLLMASEQMALGDWKDKLTGITSPRLQWRQTRSITLAIVAMGFLATCMLLPDRLIIMEIASSLNIDRDVDQLEEQIQTLEQEQIIIHPQAQELLAQLHSTETQASGQDPVKTWEALDHLRQQVDHMAQEAAQQAMQRTEQLADTQTLANAIAQTGDELSPEALALAMDELTDQLARAMDDNEQLISDLPSSLLEMLEQNQWDPQQLAQLADALQELNNETLEQLRRLVDVRLIDPETLARIHDASQDASEALALLLADYGDEYPTSELVQLCRIPGIAAVRRGAGDAPMTRSKMPTLTDPLQAQSLPPATLEALRHSQLQAVSATSSPIDTQAPPSQGGQLNTHNTGNSSATTQVILPRHRGTIQRFFNRNPNLQNQMKQ